MVTQMNGKAVLVTGAAGGIGKETALAFARLGADIFFCDTNPEGIRTTVAAIKALGCKVFGKRVDVANRDEMAAFADDVHSRVEAVDILVNNAGVGLAARFQDTTLDDWDWILGINLKGVIHGLHFFVPAMVKRGQGGHVVNIASALGYMSGQMTSAYGTTKFGVVGLTESLRMELRPEGIGVSAICPGIVNTSIVATSRRRGEISSESTGRRLVDFYKKRNYGPERVAKAILKAVRKNTALQPVTPEAHLIYFLKRLSPGLTCRLNDLNEKLIFRNRS